MLPPETWWPERIRRCDVHHNSLVKAAEPEVFICAYQQPFRARYTMEEGVVTHIEIELTNNNRDSLLLGRGSIRVKSNNIAYQYNDKFLPLPEMIIPPYQRDVVKLVGREVNGKEDWNKIAGEQLRITIKGIRAGERELAAQTAIFIPENPKVRGY